MEASKPPGSRRITRSMTPRNASLMTELSETPKRATSARPRRVTVGQASTGVITRSIPMEPGASLQSTSMEPRVSTQSTSMESSASTQSSSLVLLDVQRCPQSPVYTALAALGLGVNDGQILPVQDTPCAGILRLRKIQITIQPIGLDRPTVSSPEVKSCPKSVAGLVSGRRKIVSMSTMKESSPAVRAQLRKRRLQVVRNNLCSSSAARTRIAKLLPNTSTPRDVILHHKKMSKKLALDVEERPSSSHLVAVDSSEENLDEDGLSIVDSSSFLLEPSDDSTVLIRGRIVVALLERFVGGVLHVIRPIFKLTRLGLIVVGLYGFQMLREGFYGDSDSEHNSTFLFPAVEGGVIRNRFSKIDTIGGDATEDGHLGRLIRKYNPFLPVGFGNATTTVAPVPGNPISEVGILQELTTRDDTAVTDLILNVTEAFSTTSASTTITTSATLQPEISYEDSSVLDYIVEIILGITGGLFFLVAGGVLCYLLYHRMNIVQTGPTHHEVARVSEVVQHDSAVAGRHDAARVVEPDSAHVVEHDASHVVTRDPTHIVKRHRGCGASFHSSNSGGPTLQQVHDLSGTDRLCGCCYRQCLTVLVNSFRDSEVFGDNVGSTHILELYLRIYGTLPSEDSAREIPLDNRAAFDNFLHYLDQLHGGTANDKARRLKLMSNLVKTPELKKKSTCAPPDEDLYEQISPSVSSLPLSSHFYSARGDSLFDDPSGLKTSNWSDGDEHSLKYLRHNPAKLRRASRCPNTFWPGPGYNWLLDSARGNRRIIFNDKVPDVDEVVVPEKGDPVAAALAVWEAAPAKTSPSSGVCPDGVPNEELIPQVRAASPHTANKSPDSGRINLGGLIQEFSERMGSLR